MLDNFFAQLGALGLITAVAVTMMAPPPIPCRAREATSIVIDALRPHSTEPARKNSTDV